MGEDSPAEGQLIFEKKKWADELSTRNKDLEFRQQEILIKSEEVSLKRQEQVRSKWNNPLVIAILAASLAGAGNAVVALVNGRLQTQIEEKKASSSQRLAENQAESGRILEMIRTGDPDKAALNLQFLLDSGLISERDRVDRLSLFLASRKTGSGPSLPLPAAVVRGFEIEQTPDLTAPAEAAISSSLGDYIVYLNHLGGGEIVNVHVKVTDSPAPRAILTYQPVSRILTIDKRIVSDVDAPRLAYTIPVLLSLSKQPGTSDGTMIRSVENAVRYYLVASFAGRPQIGAGIARADNLHKSYLHNLEHRRPFQEILLDKLDARDAGEIWAGALWEIRSKIGKEVADKGVLSAWQSIPWPLKEEELPLRFIHELLKAFDLLGKSVDHSGIIEILQRRGFPIA